MTDATWILGGISAVAATVTGALGYGFSSLTVPVALLFYSARVLNPALILVEVAVNLYALFLNRRSVRRVWPRVAPLVLGLVPGVAAGALLLSRLAPTAMKTVTFLVLLPLILLQAAGVRWPFRRERAAGVPLGIGVGFLYSTTTISGPPLALFFNNQGMVKSDFKVALAVARSAESLLTLTAYAWLGLLGGESTGLLLYIAPAVLIGMPFGHWLIRRLNPETFRRVCMSFDAWVVSFGLSRLLPGALGVIIPLAAVAVDVVLLWSFFSVARRLETA